MASLAKWHCLLIEWDLSFQKYLMVGFSVFSAAFLGTSAQYARHNHFTDEYSIS